MPSEKIVFLDDSVDLRVLVSSMLKAKLGVECLGCGSVAELQANRIEVLKSKLVILDVNLGPNEPDGLDAFEWFRANGYTGKISFLTGHARSHPRLAQLSKTGVPILEKPVKSEKLCEFVRQAYGPKDEEGHHEFSGY